MAKRSDGQPDADRIGFLKSEIANLQQQNAALQAKLNSLLDENAVLYAAKLAQEGELKRRRTMHPIQQRAKTYRNPQADLQSMVTMFPRHFARMLSIPEGMLLGKFRSEVGTALRKVYPNIVRSSARAVLEGRIEGLSKPGNIPVHMRNLVENSLTMLDVLESIAAYYGEKEAPRAHLDPVSQAEAVEEEVTAQ